MSPEGNDKLRKGFILLSRSFFESTIWNEFSSDQLVVSLFLIAAATYGDGTMLCSDGMRRCLRRGQVYTNLGDMQKKLPKGVSIQNIRTALRKLESIGFLTQESTNQGRLITLVNYHMYQLPSNYVTGKSTGRTGRANKATSAEELQKRVSGPLMQFYKSNEGEKHTRGQSGTGTPDSPCSGPHVLVDAFGELFRTKYGAEYVSSSRDYGFAKTLVDQLGLDECLARMKRAFAHKYWFGEPKTLGEFYYRINDVVESPHSSQKGEGWWGNSPAYRSTQR